MSHYAVLPATPLAALTVGQSDLLASALPLAAGRLPSLADGSELVNPHRLLIGRFDATFAMIFFTAADHWPELRVARGRAGAWHTRAPAGATVDVRALFAGKLAPRVMLIGGLLALFVAMSTAIVTGSTWPRLALWFAVAIAYVAFWFALTAAVVTRPGGTATHALTLAAAWLSLTLLVPSGVNLAVKTMARCPHVLDARRPIRPVPNAASFSVHFTRTTRSLLLPGAMLITRVPRPLAELRGCARASFLPRPRRCIEMRGPRMHPICWPTPAVNAAGRRKGLPLLRMRSTSSQ